MSRPLALAVACLAIAALIALFGIAGAMDYVPPAPVSGEAP